MKKETTYLLLLTAIYFAVSLVGVMHHELWLDEAHHYLLARDSNSFADLIQNTRTEGHPILWNVLLYGLTRFTANPFWMQFLHILISTSVVLIFIRKSPFSLVFKTLFIFGYFMLFEYNLISRNYILGVLFLFWACSVFENRKEKFTLLCIYLALAANIHLMFSVIAFALFLTLLFENYQSKELFQKKYIPGYLIFGFGILVLGIQLQSTNSDWFFTMLGEIPWSEKFGKGFISLFKGLIAIPDFSTIHFWNSNFIVNESRPLAAVLGLLIYLVPLILCYKSKKTLFFVYVALIGTQVFFFVTLRAATRFHGMTYIILIMALWIQQYYATDTYNLKTLLDRFKVALLQKPIIFGILIIHFFCGAAAYAFDYVYPFTASKDTVSYLKKHDLSDKEVVTFSCDGTTISSYLGRKLYFLTDESHQSYCIWSTAYNTQYSSDIIIAKLTTYMKKNDSAVFISGDLFIKCEPNVWQTVNHQFKIRLLKKLDKTLLENGTFYVFEVSKTPNYKS